MLKAKGTEEEGPSTSKLVLPAMRAYTEGVYKTTSLILVFVLLLAWLEGALAAPRVVAVRRPDATWLQLVLSEAPGPETRYRYAGADWMPAPTSRPASEVPLQVLVAVDSTGTMDARWEELVRGLEGFFALLDQTGRRYETRGVMFSDSVGPAFGDEGGSSKAVLAGLAGYLAGGGFDEPESSLDAALWLAAEPASTGARRMLLLFTDAPFHFRGDGTLFSQTTLTTSQALLQAEGVSVFCWAPAGKGYEQLAKATGGAWFDCEKSYFGPLLEQVAGRLAREYLLELQAPTEAVFAPSIRVRLDLAPGDEALDAPWWPQVGLLPEEVVLTCAAPAGESEALASARARGLLFQGLGRVLWAGGKPLAHWAGEFPQSTFALKQALEARMEVDPDASRQGLTFSARINKQEAASLMLAWLERHLLVAPRAVEWGFSALPQGQGLTKIGETELAISAPQALGASDIEGQTDE